MDTLSSIAGQGLDYIKRFKFPRLSTLIPIWPFSKGEPFEEDIPDPAEEEEVTEEDTGDTGEEEVVAKEEENSLTKGVDPFVMLIINIVLIFLYYIFIFILASLVANDLIYAHWGVRLFSFCFVVYLCFRTSAVVYPISIYYIINALYNVFRNYRDKPLDPETLKLWHPKPMFPRRYAFLPIMTSRSVGVLDLLNPFSYFPQGDDPKEPKYANYTYDAAKYKEDLNMLIPDFLKYQDQFLGTLLKKFKIYFAEFNKPHIKFSDAKPDESDESDESKQNALKAVKEQIKGAIVTATGLEESAKYISQSLKPT